MERKYLPEISGYIHRPRVDALYKEGLEYPVVLVLAGPGYGKTLSASGFMKKADICLVWTRISNHRRVAGEFWEDFERAAGREMPEYAQKLHELGFPSNSGSFEVFRRHTVEAAAACKRLVLVVDNYERILDKNVLAFFDNLIDSEPANVTLCILCNVRLPFTEVLPSKGQFRITDEDLAFTVEEAGMMFGQYGVEVPAATVEEAVRGTGGWPLGLRLISSGHPGSGDERGLFGKTSLQLAADLFEQNYFSGYSREVQTQMIRIAMLPQFSLDMVTGGVGGVDGDFYKVLRQHPFVAYDFSSDLYTWQPMYHDFLQHKQALISPESRQEFYAFAGRWFIERGMSYEAMDCFWEASEYEDFLRAVNSLPKVRCPAGQTERILHRLEQIQRTYADKNPDVLFCMAFMHLNAGRARRARELLLEVESRLLAGPETKASRLLLGDVYAALADIGSYLNEDTGLAWAKKAYELIPGGSRIHSPQLMVQGNNSLFFLPDNQPGQLERMVDYMMEMAVYAEPVMRGNGYGYEFQFAGEAAYYREDMDRAAIMFNSAILKGQQSGQHDIVCNALWGLMRIEFYFANYKNAQALMNEIVDYVSDKGVSMLLELRDCVLAWFYMRLDDCAKVPTWFARTMTGPEELPVDLGRNRLTSAYYLYMLGETAKAYAVMMQMETVFAHRGRWYEKFSLYMLEALYHMAAGAPEAFAEAFGRAYEMAYGNDLKVMLSAYGKDVMAVIDQVRRTETDQFDMDWLDAVYKDATSFGKRLQTMRRAYRGEAHPTAHSTLALTRREDETLRYLAQGLTQQEMAKLMGISANAIKKHVKKIYYKLGAMNRADAIHIASINGLVDIINN